MPYFIQDRGSGLYVTTNSGMTDIASDAATFDTYEDAMRHRSKVLEDLGSQADLWDLRVRMGRGVGD